MNVFDGLWFNQLNKQPKVYFPLIFQFCYLLIPHRSFLSLNLPKDFFFFSILTKKKKKKKIDIFDAFEKLDEWIREN